MILSSLSMTSNFRRPVEDRDENFNKEYNVELLTNVIEYNRKKYLAFKNELPFEINTDYERILKARYQKASRIRKRLVFLLSRYKYIWFITFTFNNNYINKSTRTKRDLIKMVLNTHDFKYMLNIDYGKKNEREHYHCILATNIDLDVNQFIQFYYEGGFSLSIQCKNGLDDFKRLSKYLNKLTNHCIKATTKRQRILYNFKGYDILYPTSSEQRIAYLLDYFQLFNVGLLDKANIT